MPDTKYLLCATFFGAMAALSSSSSAQTQSVIAPPKCVSAVVLQAVLGYSLQFHNNCQYTVTVYWGPNLGDGAGIIESSAIIPAGGTAENESKSSEIADMRYFSCPALSYKLTTKTSLGVTVKSYDDSKTLVCWRLG
jgi:hypothetical protein